MAGFLAVLARPGGLLQTLLADEAIANGMNLRAPLPADVAFDLFDFDRNDKVSFRLRGRLPKEVAAMPAWLQFAAVLQPAPNTPQSPLEIWLLSSQWVITLPSQLLHQMLALGKTQRADVPPAFVFGMEYGCRGTA